MLGMGHGTHRRSLGEAATQEPAPERFTERELDEAAPEAAASAAASEVRELASRLLLQKRSASARKRL